MASMAWTQELEVGIGEIDVQHRQFVDLINTLDDAIQSSNQDGVRHVIEGVLAYTITHFGYEEDLMQKAGFPGLSAHQKSHEYFMRKLSVLRGRQNAGEDVSLLLSSMLMSWVDTHIKREDRDYVDSVRNIMGGA